MQDGLDRLDLVERNRRAGRLEAEQAAQRRALAALVVNQPRVLLEDRVLARAGRVLQAEHRLGVEQVDLAVAAPLVLAAALELDRARRAAAERARVPLADFLRDRLHADAADARGAWR